LYQYHHHGIGCSKAFWFQTCIATHVSGMPTVIHFFDCNSQLSVWLLCCCLHIFVCVLLICSPWLIVCLWFDALVHMKMTWCMSTHSHTAGIAYYYYTSRFLCRSVPLPFHRLGLSFHCRKNLSFILNTVLIYIPFQYQQAAITWHMHNMKEDLLFYIAHINVHGEHWTSQHASQHRHVSWSRPTRLRASSWFRRRDVKSHREVPCQQRQISRMFNVNETKLSSGE